MKILRNYWQFISLGLLTILIAYLFLGTGQQLPSLQKIMIYQFMALLVHQSEEYIFPGGAGLVIIVELIEKKLILNAIPAILNQLC